MSRAGGPYGCVRVCAGLTVCAERVWENIYHGPKQESSQGVLNGPACLEKPFSKWMPLSIRVSDRNLPRAMPAGNKIASLCAPLPLHAQFILTDKKKCKVCANYFGVCLTWKETGKYVYYNVVCSVPLVEIAFFLTSKVGGELKSQDRAAQK